MNCKGGRRPSLRWALGLAASVTTVFLSAPVAFAAPGDLDPSFGAGGKQTLNFGGTDRGTHVALTPDGRIVVVGSTDATGSGDFAVARFDSNGTPDSSFGAGGKVTLGTQAGVNDIGGGVVVLPSEQIVVSGQGNASKDFVTKRLNANGSLDTTFAAGGTSVVNFGGTDAVNAMVSQPDGKLVLVGSTSATGGGDFAIARLNGDGTPDTSFSGDGKQTVNFGGVDTAVAVAIAPDGGIVVVGQGGANQDLAAVRLNPDGSVDTSFAPATSGKAYVDFNGNDAATGVALQPDGKIVMVGATSAVAAGDFAVARLNADGSLDTTFSGDGKLTLGYNAPNEQALAVAIQQNGRIVVFGQGDANHDFVLSRLETNGSIDTSFGSSGTIAVDFGGFEYDGDIALAPDGNLVIAGSTNVTDGGDFALARIQGDPISTTTTTTTTTTNSTTPPAQTGPSARIILGDSVKLPGATRLSGFSSAPSPGARLIDYHWAITGPTPIVDAGCGQSPVLSHPFTKTGLYTALLTVTDSTGRKATTARFIPITKLKISPRSDTQTFACENPAKGEQPSTADCVKSFGFSILDVNSRGGPSDCFNVVHADVGGTTYYKGTVAGPVAINGLYLPVPAGVKTSYNGYTHKVAIANAERVSLRIGPFETQKIDLGFKVEPNKFLVFHVINVDSSTQTPKFLGALPIRGAFGVDLIYHKSFVKIGLGLPSPLSFGGKVAAQGDVRLISDNVNGLHYDGLSLTLPQVWLGPLFVSGLNFNYTKSTNSWGGGAKVTLPGSAIAIDAAGPPTQPPDFGFGIINGKFDHAGFGIDFNPPTQPDLFPPFNTVLLSHIGAAVGINPLRLTGTIGLNAAHLVNENGVLFGVFASPDNQYSLPENVGPELAPLASRTFDSFSLAIAGTAEIKVPILGQLPLLNAYGLYEYPDYFEFGGGFSFGVSLLQIDGGVSGFVYPSDRTFNLQGGVKACLRNVEIGFDFFSVKISPCVNVGAVISSKGLGFCAVVPVPTPFGTVPVAVGAGYKWGDKTPDLMIFSCDYKAYTEVSKRASASAAGQGYSVTLPRGLPAAMLRVRGSGAAPTVIVTDPRGHPIGHSPDAFTVGGTEPDTTLVALHHPLAGRWVVTPAAGSAPIVDVASADGLPPVGISARVSGRNGKRILRYRMTPAAGRTVRFIERGAATVHVLGLGKGRSGAIKFTPGAGRRGRRTIVALIDQAGAPARSVTVATYSAPGRVSLGRPGGVRATRQRGKVRVAWRRVSGAIRYEVLVRLADHSETFRLARGTQITLADPFPAKRGQVSVDALGRDGRRGKASIVGLPRGR